MVLKKIKRGLVTALVLVFLLSSCEEQNKQKSVEENRLHYSDAIMGTTFTVKIPRVPDSINSNDLNIKIKTLLDKINGRMSTYLPHSELSQFNENRSTQWIKVSEQLFAVIKEAKVISEISNGAFDITVGNLVNLWGFGPGKSPFKKPKDKQLQHQLRKVGYKKLELKEETLQIRKLNPYLYLDLSAIAKGYAVDQVGALIEKQGIDSYMVEIGGELRLRGNNAQQKPWRIAVEKPTVSKRVIQRRLSITNLSMATSGDYRNFFEVKDKRYSHSIDPRSGRPITHKLASITVLSDTTMKADALATAFMILGPEEGYALAEKENIAALFISKIKGGFTEQASSAFIQQVR